MFTVFSGHDCGFHHAQVDLARGNPRLRRSFDLAEQESRIHNDSIMGFDVRKDLEKLC